LDRRHTELTPVFLLGGEILSNGQAALTLQLLGPPGLVGVDRITVSVRDDSRDRSGGVMGHTPEEIERQIWGPFRFMPGVDGADRDGRTLAPFPLELGNYRRLEMIPTVGPPWLEDPDSWHALLDLPEIRLSLKCEREGYDSWIVPVSVAPRERLRVH
jgi:hypothetical protein